MVLLTRRKTALLYADRRRMVGGDKFIMTVLGWIGFLGIAIFIILICEIIAVFIDGGYVTALGIAAILIIGICIAMHWYYGNTQSGKRAIKSQESNFNEGIERTVKVYDVNGELITEYDGKFDITYDDDRILFDDENGKRHVIYYPTGTVVIDER